MTLKAALKSSTKTKPRPATRRYVDINEVPDLIARVIQNEAYINSIATKKNKVAH